MFLKLFNSKSVYSVILIPLVAFLFWMESLRFPQAMVVTQGEGMMPLYIFFAGFFNSNALWPVLTGFVLLLLNGLILSLLSLEFQFLQQRTFLPGILYVCIVSSFPSLQTFHPVYPATLSVLAAIFFIFSTYHRKNEISSTFNASFCLSVGALFYFPVVTLLPLIWVSIFVLQKNDNWRLLVIPLIGLSIPWLFLWAFLFIAGDENTFVSSILQGMRVVNNQFIFNVGFLVLTAFIFLLSAFGSLSLINSVSIRKMSTRKYFIILFWLLGLSIPSVFLFPSTGLGIVAITTMPVSFMIAIFFMAGKRGLWKEILFTLFLLTIVVCHLVLYE